MKLFLISVFSVTVLGLVGCDTQSLVPLRQTRLETAPSKTIGVRVPRNCEAASSERLDFFAVSLSRNLEVKHFKGTDYFVFAPDSDSDGISDREEISHRLDLCLDNRSADSFPDAFGDAIVHALRLSCEDQATLSVANIQDSDGDGLNDSEEKLIGYDWKKWDTDDDGIPDPVELRFGTNALVPNYGSWSGDGLTDLEKIRRGLPFNFPSTPELDRFSLRYATEVSESPAGRCYEDSVQNISLMTSIGSNLLAFYKISAKNGERLLQVRYLRVPSSIADGTELSVPWDSLEASREE